MNPDAKYTKEGVTVMELAKITGNKEALKFLGKLKLEVMRDKVYKPVIMTKIEAYFSYSSYSAEEYMEFQAEPEKEISLLNRPAPLKELIRK